MQNNIFNRIGNTDLECQIMHKAINKYEQAKT